MATNREEYDEYINAQAFFLAKDGEHGLGIWNRAEKLRGILSLKEYALGKRLRHKVVSKVV